MEENTPIQFFERGVAQMQRAAIANPGAPRRSLLSGGGLVFLASAARDNFQSAFALSQGARIHTSRSSSVVKITGMALG